MPHKSNPHMHIELTTTPTEAELKTLSRGIQSYNQHYLPDEVVFEADNKFVVLAKDDSGVVQGGLRATAFWHYCIIELL